MDLDQYWTGWEPIVHSVITVVAGYIALLIMLRLSGARTMASMTPLDAIVAITIGSAFGRTVTAVDVPLTQVFVALGGLIFLQWMLAWVRGRSPRMRRLMDAPPVLVYYQGEFQRRAMRRHQLTADDVHTAARNSGHGALNSVGAVIMQQNGALSVIGGEQVGDGSSIWPFVEDDGHGTTGEQSAQNQ